MTIYDRTLDALRHLEATSTPEQRQALARDIRIGDAWPEPQRTEAQAIMGRIQSGGKAAPSWGHAHNILARIR